MIKVLVWAKSAITRAGLESLVRADPRFEVCDAHGHIGDLVGAVRALAPDVVLLDAPGQSLLNSLVLGISSSRASQLVVLAEDPSRSQIRQMLQSVRGLLSNDAAPEEIVSALAAVVEGLAVLSPEFLDLLLPAGTDASPNGMPLGEPLTVREIEVLSLLAEGAANKEIASRLHISEHTVKFHVSAILGKLGAASRTEAVSRGYREGLIIV